MAKNVPVGYVDFVLQISRSGDPDPYVVTFGGEVAAPPFTAADAAFVAAAATAQLPDALMDMDTMVGLTAYVANDGPPFIYEIPMATVGDQSGEALPQNNAVIVTKSTGLGGRWNKGRMFWPSVLETAVGNTGILTAPYLSILEGALNGFRGATTPPTADAPLSEWVVFHDESLAIPPTPVTELIIEPVIGTQRRRLRR